MKFLKKPILLSILAGILLGTSTIPFPPWALFFCLTPLIHIWLTEKPRNVFLYSLLSFFIGSLISLNWFSFLLVKFAKMPFAVSATVTVFICLFYHIHLAAAGWFFSKYLRNKTKFKITTACAFLAIVWYIFPVIFPWNFALAWYYGGLSAYQFLDLIGADGLHAISIFICGLAYFAFVKSVQKSFTPSLYLALFLIGFNGLGHLHGQSLDLGDQKLKVAISQANIGNMEDFSKKAGYGFEQAAINKYIDNTNKALAGKEADLIMWPETAYPTINTRHFNQSWQGRSLFSVAQSNNSSLITGIFSENKKGQITNTALALNHNGEIIGDPIEKVILLAFGEYLPGETYFPFLRKLFPMIGDFTPGEDAVVVRTKKALAGVQICYEALFPWFSRRLAQKGAEVIANVSNDSWYGNYAEPEQHLYLSSLRALETRLPLIRSTNTGHSSVILANGKMLEVSPLNKEWAGYYLVPFKKKPSLSFYVRFGHLLTLPLLLIVFMISLNIWNTKN